MDRAGAVGLDEPAGTGTFNWTVTGPATTQARVRITWTGNSQVTDTSNVNFAIQ